MFLRTLRASIIPIITIPVSLVGSFALMALAGLFHQHAHLAGAGAGDWLVVDDAIVMLENIYRTSKRGSIRSRRHQGCQGNRLRHRCHDAHAGGRVCAAGLHPGRTGRLFVEFALALAGAVVVSGFVALTLSPMMCSLLLKHNPKPNWFDRSMERWLTAMSDAYGRLLRWVVTARWGGGGGCGARCSRPAGWWWV